MLSHSALSRCATAMGSLAVVLALLLFVTGPPDLPESKLSHEPATESHTSLPDETVYGKVTNHKAAPIADIHVVVSSFTAIGETKVMAATRTLTDGSYQTSFTGRCGTYRVRFTLSEQPDRIPSNNIREIRMCPGHAYRISAQFQNNSQARFLILPILRTHVDARELDVTWLTRIMAFVVTYYCALYCIAAWRRVRRRRMRASPRPGQEECADHPAVVLVIPAHNEQEVIGQTLRSLLNLDYSRLTILVMNDGSSDQTSQIAASFSSRVLVIDREPAIAGQGKGAVLNHAFQIVVDLVEDTTSPLAGLPMDQIVVGVMDADGQLEPDALQHIAPMFRDRKVGGLQIGVRIANAGDNTLARMQDIEFVGFSSLVQDARNLFGSVGLGGNGQFARLSALISLGRDPWTGCLSEDLDLGLSLLEHGWALRFCPTTFVAQQGLTKVRPLLKQRARWVHGHYQCWKHLPRLASSSRVPVQSKIDVSIYLTFITFVLVLGVCLALSVLNLTGRIQLVQSFFDGISDGPYRRLAILFLSFAPAIQFLDAYQRNARVRLRAYEVPWYMLAFSVYCYHWLFAQFWAYARMISGRKGWAKTPRITAHPAVASSTTTSGTAK